MVSLAARAWRYVFGPNIDRIHFSTDGRNRAYNYYQNDIEQLAQRFLTVAYYFKCSLYYSSPLIPFLLYNRGCCLLATLINILHLCGWSAVVVGGVLLVRGFGRSQNQEYVLFLDTLESCLDDPHNRELKKFLRRYDFDFTFWPVDYTSTSVKEGRELGRHRSFTTFWKRVASYTNSHQMIHQGLPKELFAYVMSNTIGLWLMYPGSVGLFKIACASSMLIHRSRLIEERGGFRAKLRAEDGNEIDTIFFDRRLKSQNEDGGDLFVLVKSDGDTLVICCEGNAGFYECGCLGTPLECGYSVLGWNHPGFMCSTGRPYPESDINALHVVMEYALKELKFKPSDIILFGWSIGSFSAISVASSYPDLKGIVLDAAFADSLVFAKQMVLPCFETLVTQSVRKYLDLNNSLNLRKYKGPIVFIRREKDEVMNLNGPELASSNAGNDLLEDFLLTRFPNLFDKRPCGVFERESSQTLMLRRFLSLCNEDCRDSLLGKWDANSEEAPTLLIKEIQEGRGFFPMEIGIKLSPVQRTRLLLFLANKYLHHFNSSHCTPLPPALFVPPWQLKDLLQPENRKLTVKSK